MLILASASPRRKEMLMSLGIDFEVIPADIDESRQVNELAADFVVRLASEKAWAVAKEASAPVLAADTIVCDGDYCFGKPLDKADAFNIWKKLSGGEHQVLTALALANEGETHIELSTSRVKFSEITELQMQSYWESGEPQDKAGAYGIQGLAAAWVESISGSHSGIVGLPLFELNRLLTKIQLNWL